MPQCAPVVASSARARQTAAIVIMIALPVADVAFQCCRAHLKNSNFPLRHRPINQPPRLLYWRIQETLVGTCSNAARFSGVSRTINRKALLHIVRGEPHTSLKHYGGCRLLEWIHQAKNKSTFVDVASPAENNQEHFHECGFALDKLEQ